MFSFGSLWLHFYGPRVRLIQRFYDKEFKEKQSKCNNNNNNKHGNDDDDEKDKAKTYWINGEEFKVSSALIFLCKLSSYSDFALDLQKQMYSNVPISVPRTLCFTELLQRSFSCKFVKVRSRNTSAVILHHAFSSRTKTYSSSIVFDVTPRGCYMA